MKYQYQLNSRAIKKHTCPECGHKTFNPYVYTDTEDIVDAERYGRCDREHKCQYNQRPPTKKKAAQTLHLIKQYKKPSIKQPNPMYIPRSTYEQFKIKDNMTLPKFFSLLPIQEDHIRDIIEQYEIGYTFTMGRNFILFPYIDKDHNITCVQAKEFNKNNRTIYTSWLHTIRQDLFSEDFLHKYRSQHRIVTAFFGEHLIERSRRLVIHESPKNAIYYTAHTGESFINVATFNKTSARRLIGKLHPSQKATLLPDPDAIQSWSQLRSKNINLVTSPNGKDIADYLQYDKWY